MPRKPIEIKSGTKFGLLTVLKHVEDFRYPNGNKVTAYKCLCECGNEKVIDSLVAGRFCVFGADLLQTNVCHSLS